MKKRSLQIKSIIHYWMGSLLFFSGFARLHVVLHEFSMRQLQRAADSGLAKAQLLFGQLLIYRGASAANKIAGIKYLQTSALEGSKDARFMLAESMTSADLINHAGLMDNVGLDANNALKIDLQDPVELYRLAAEAGHTMAALRLSKIYRQGDFGMNTSIEQADYWLQEFMEQGKQV
jgi:TPR repeat protein